MIAFALAAGLLLAGALLFVLPPLMGGRHRRGEASHDHANIAIYRDQLRELENDLASGAISQAQHDESRREIEKRLVEEVGADAAAGRAPERGGRGIALAVGMAVPVLAVALYALIGTPEGLDPGSAQPQDQAGAHAMTPEQVVQMTEQLAQRLKTNPNDPEGWVMLARSYAALQRFNESAQAYARAVEQVPGNAQLLADFADTVAMAQGRDLMGEPEKLIARALQADPNNVKALALAGTVAYQKKDFATARVHWQKILAVVPPESEIAAQIQGGIRDAERAGGLRAGAPAAGAPAVAAAPAGGGSVGGSVVLAPALAAKVSPGDTVFVFARAAEGPRMPLAIVRKQVKDLPFDFKLDDSMAMAPNMKLSSFPKLVVGARVSRSGNATPQPGDLEGMIAPVALGASGLRITIDAEVR